MNEDIDFDEVFRKYRSDPYDHVDIHSIHTGQLRFRVAVGDQVEGRGGEWDHIPGTVLYMLNRERNPKQVHSPTNGIVSFVRTDLDGLFVEAGEKIITIKHPLKKREIIDGILKQVLFSFKAPERAKYFFSMEIQSRIEKYGQKKVSIKPGEELFTMSLMKRETPVYYAGEPGIIHSVYFKNGESIEQGEPLVGICPKEKLPVIQKIITRVKAEWE
ncbi:MAG: hypothetical protein KKG47_16095 [Proteobacteria bacterium]|nr:hypothetical protein [Pseudomonadota bacterium]MBU1739598.1 hypothetical protein [Pseudomonadota bacterium]